MNLSTPSKYEVQARIVPALLCCVPFIASGFYLFNRIDAHFWHAILPVSIGGIGLSYALYRLAINACRLAGKFLEEYIFKSGKDFPTTTFLLDNNTNCSRDRKAAVIAKIKKEFKINLQGKTSDTPANRTAIHEAIGQIRKRFFYSSTTVLQCNIYFGFVRNLAGGSIVAAMASALGFIGSWAFNATNALYVMLCLLIAYSLTATLSILSIRFTANHYAHTLFDEFLAN